MDTQAEYWRKQQLNKPLYPDLIWSRPENRMQAGKLLIIGGNVNGFASIAGAYNAATQAGVGSIRIILPSALQQTVAQLFTDAEYAPSTPSGSFARKSLDLVLDGCSWADGVLLAGDLGHNSETAIMIEQFIKKYAGQLTVTGDSLDYFNQTAVELFNREQTLLALNLPSLQKLGQSVHFSQAFTSSMDILRLVEGLHELSNAYKASFIVNHLETIFCADHGNVITTKVGQLHTWPVDIAAAASVWWLQNPNNTLASLATAIASAKA